MKRRVVEALRDDAADVVRFLGFPIETEVVVDDGLAVGGPVGQGGAKPCRAVFSVTTRGSTNCRR